MYIPINNPLGGGVDISSFQQRKIFIDAWSTFNRGLSQHSNSITSIMPPNKENDVSA